MNIRSSLLSMSLLAGCGGGPSHFATGDASLWVAANPSVAAGGAESLEIDGLLVAEGPAARPEPEVFWIGGGGPATRTFTVRVGSTGEEWTVGYRLLASTMPDRDVTPELPVARGTTVHLRVRAVRGFGSAPAVVLSDARGVVFAMDLAVYGDPLHADDVPGLTVGPGAVVGYDDGECFRARHTALVFTGDAAVAGRPGQPVEVAVMGTPFTAITIYNYTADGPDIRCTDITGEGRAWAVWRKT